MKCAYGPRCKFYLILKWCFQLSRSLLLNLRTGTILIAGNVENDNHYMYWTKR